MQRPSVLILKCWRSIAVALAATAALVGAAGPLGASTPDVTPCGPWAGPCDQPNATPGCDEPECCAAVCGFFPPCCDIAWDMDCVDFRVLFPDACEGTYNPACGPGTGSCTAPNSTPGCDDLKCCDQVCEIDPFCCEQAWDFACAAVAIQFCGVWPCAVECPGSAISEMEPCGKALNDGCNLSKPKFVNLPFDTVVCGQVWANLNQRDTDWYLVHAGVPANEGPIELVISVVAEPAVAILLIDTMACPLATPMVIQAAFGGGCQPTKLHASVHRGSYAIVVTPGTSGGPIFNGFPCGTLNAYTLSVARVGATRECAADLDGDAAVTGSDLGIMLQQWGGAGSGDLDGNGVVDGGDLGLLLQSWGPC